MIGFRCSPNFCSVLSFPLLVGHGRISCHSQAGYEADQLPEQVDAAARERGERGLSVFHVFVCVFTRRAASHHLTSSAPDSDSRLGTLRSGSVTYYAPLVSALL